MSDERNVVKSTDLQDASKHPSAEEAQEEKAAPEKKAAPKKKAAAKKSPPKLEDKIAKAKDGHKLIFFQSGAAYVTKDGQRFTRDEPIHEVENELADFLLTLPNFRLPDNLELEEYKIRRG